MWPFTKDLADKLAEDAAGPSLDEDPRARGIHTLDLLDEADRLCDLTG